MKLNLGCHDHRLDGFENLDLPNWRFEDGLPYPDGSVEAITISHSLMYVPLSAWPAALAEVARVLEPGGIVRVTEDNTEDPESERFGGFHDAVTLTGPTMMRDHLKAAGLRIRKQTATTSGFRDMSLCQAYHGQEPKVFFIEGRKPA